jgi:hypothetical protein
VYGSSPILRSSQQLLHQSPFRPCIHRGYATIPNLPRAKGSSHDGHGVVVEYSRNVFRGELVGGIADKKTCLSDRTVADDDAPVRQ